MRVETDYFGDSDWPASNPHQEVEELADTLEERGIIFRTIPDNTYPGMRYTTPTLVAQSGVSRYSEYRIRIFAENGEITATKLNGKVAITPEGVQELLDRESQRMQSTGPGLKPGPLKTEH